MPLRVLTKKDEKFIEQNYLKLSSREMATRLKVPRGTISSFLRRKNLKVPEKVSMRFRKAAMNKLHDEKYPVEDWLIREFYLLMPLKTIADLLGRYDTFVRSRMKRMKIKVPRKIVNEWIERSRRKKGWGNPNKGKKQHEFMSAEMIEHSKKTRFKKGQVSLNTLYDGAITIRHDHPDRNGGRPIKHIRIAKGKWKELQIYNWEKKNGPVPKGYVLACKNGNTLDCKASNWYLLSKADNARRNAGHIHLPDSYVAHLLAGHKHRDMKEEFLKDKELIQTKRALIQLNRKIKIYGSK
jgi:hypothetical protein